MSSVLELQVIQPELAGDLIINQLVAIEKSLFAKPFFSEEEYVGILSSPENVNIILKDKEEHICGYVSAIPHNAIVREVRSFHPDFPDKDNCYYIDTIEVLPGYSGQGLFKVLLAALAHEVLERFNIKRWSTHVRVQHGFDKVIMRMFPEIDVSYKVYNFLGKGEDYLYLEGSVSDESIRKMETLLERYSSRVKCL